MFGIFSIEAVQTPHHCLQDQLGKKTPSSQWFIIVYHGYSPSALRRSHRLKRLFIISHGLRRGESDFTLKIIPLSGKRGRNEIDLIELLSGFNEMVPVEQLG